MCTFTVFPRGSGWECSGFSGRAKTHYLYFQFWCPWVLLPILEEILERAAEPSGSLRVLLSRLAPWHKACHLLIRPCKLCLTVSGEKVNSAKGNTSGSV